MHRYYSEVPNPALENAMNHVMHNKAAVMMAIVSLGIFRPANALLDCSHLCDPSRMNALHTVVSEDLARMPAWKLVANATRHFLSKSEVSAANIYRDEIRRRRLQHEVLLEFNPDLTLSPEALAPSLAVGTLRALWNHGVNPDDGTPSFPYHMRTTIDGVPVVLFDLPWPPGDAKHLYVAEIVDASTGTLIARWVAWQWAIEFPDPAQDRFAPRDDQGSPVYAHPIEVEQLRSSTLRLRLRSTGLPRRGQGELYSAEELRVLATRSQTIFEVPMPGIDLYEMSPMRDEKATPHTTREAPAEDVTRMPAWKLIGHAMGQHLRDGRVLYRYQHELSRRRLRHESFREFDPDIVLSPEALAPELAMHTLFELWNPTVHPDDGMPWPYNFTATIDGVPVILFDLPDRLLDSAHLYIAEIVDASTNELIARWFAWPFMGVVNPIFAKHAPPRDDAGLPVFKHPVEVDQLRSTTLRLRLRSTGVPRNGVGETFTNDQLRNIADDSTLIFELPMPSLDLYVPTSTLP